MNNMIQKIEQLELELPQLMDTIQMNTAQMDQSTLQMRVMSDQTEPLDEMQIQVRIFLQKQISKCTLDITDCTNRMMEISTRLIEQRGLVNAIHNDGTNPKAFAEDGRTTDRTKDSLPKRDIANVEGVQQEGPSKRSLVASTAESNESFNTVTNAASHPGTDDTIVKKEPTDVGAPDGNGMNALLAVSLELAAHSPPSSIQSFGAAEVSRIPALTDSDKGGSEYNLPVPAQGKGICLSAASLLYA